MKDPEDGVMVPINIGTIFVALAPVALVIMYLIHFLK